MSKDILILTFWCVIVPALLIFAIWYINQNRKKREAERVAAVWARRNEWGDDFCQSIINRRIAIDMTEEMVIYAWGKPYQIENKELTKRGQKTRWIYGQPRKGASYVWFTDGKVTKIQQ